MCGEKKKWSTIIAEMRDDYSAFEWRKKDQDQLMSREMTDAKVFFMCSEQMLHSTYF